MTQYALCYEAGLCIMGFICALLEVKLGIEGYDFAV